MNLYTKIIKAHEATTIELRNLIEAITGEAGFKLADKSITFQRSYADATEVLASFGSNNFRKPKLKEAIDHILLNYENDLMEYGVWDDVNDIIKVIENDDELQDIRDNNVAPYDEIRQGDVL